MEKITSTTLLPFIIRYFDTLGLEADASTYFTANHFTSALVINLPGVCLIPKNRPSVTKGNQTHIHITGTSREFFFDKSIIDSNPSENIDVVKDVEVSLTNIKSLNKLDLTACNSLDIIKSFTNIKYAVGHQSQVQVSKIRSDGQDFISLRNGLFLHDLLIFLKDNDEQLFAVGIPASFYEDTYDVSDGIYPVLESKGIVTLKTVLLNLEKTVDTSILIPDEDEFNDTLYQQLVNDIDDNLPVDTAESYHPEDYTGSSDGKKVHTNRPSTNPELGKKSIKANGYKCIFSSHDEPHDTFLKANGKPYMEAHHIIPVGMQSHFKKKLDTLGNIVPVCPLCHRKLHHGCKSDIDILLNQLFSIREDALTQSGLSVSLDTLKSFYY